MFKLLRKNLRTIDVGLLFAVTGLMVLSVYLELLMPDFMTKVTQLITDLSSQTKDIWIEGLKMLGCALGSAVVTAFTSLLCAYIASGFAKRVREKLYSKIESLSQNEINQFSTASLITRTTNDVNQIQMVLTMGLQSIIKAPILAVWALVKIFNKGTTGWVVATGVAVAVLVIVLSTLLVICLPKFKRIQKQTDAVNNIARENLTGLRVVKAFNADEFEKNKFATVNSSLTSTNMFTGIAMSVMNPVMSGIMNGLTLSIYWIGAYAINAATTSLEKVDLLSNMMVFSSYSMQVVMAFMLLIAIFMILPRAMVSGKRINEIMNTEVAIKEGVFEGETNEKGTLVFDHVTFGYDSEDKTDKEDVLTDISFKVDKGDTLAIIGATGSGKTTLVSLAARLYDPDQGTVSIDGENVKSYTFESLYNKLAFVSQKAVLFSGNIENNILYGKSLGGTKEDCERAIEISQSKEFVDKKDEGVFSKIEQAGKNVSGGQKQRLSIARAIARNPEIIIFDDSFSALDYKTDTVLRGELNEKMKDTTKIIVAQRIGTIRHANCILVLDEGKIVGRGTHDELLKTCPVYQEIANSQLSKEELENA